MSSNTSEAATAAREQQPEDDQEQATQQGSPVTSQGAGVTSVGTGQSEMPANQPKPDLSDQDHTELLPKLMGYFHNNREELARALGLHRSTVDRWLNGTSRPNNSTVLRMRRLAQERGIT
jgi:transcriptional regulator with XRE-family HTH domain